MDLEMVEVHYDEHGGDLRVYADKPESLEEWGMCLAEVARAIARAHSDAPKDFNDVFAAICDGFRKAIKPRKRRQCAAAIYKNGRSGEDG